MTVSSPPDLLSYFRRALPLILLALLALLFSPTLTELAARWSEWHEGLSHGWLVLAIFVYLLWRSTPWQQHSTRWRWFSYALVLAGSLLWLALQAVHIAVLAEFAVLAIFIVVLAALYGWRSIWQHKAILFLPIFASSIWGDLNNLLVTLSGWAVGQLLGLFNITAHMDGNSIFLPYGHMVIADGCSGLRYLVVALAIGYIQACLNGYSSRAFVIAVVVAGILGLVANWLRIFILVLVGYYTHMQSHLLHDHELFGWILFAVLVFGPLFFAPAGRLSFPRAEPVRHSLAQLGLVLACAAAGPVGYALADLTPHPVAFKEQLPVQLEPVVSGEMPMLLQLSNAGYKELGFDKARNIYIQVNQYQRQTVEDKLVPYIGRLFDTERWVETERRMPIGFGQPASLSLYRHKLTQQSIVQLQWFALGDRRTRSLAMAKLWQLPAILRGDNHFQMITLQADCLTDCAAAEQLLYAAAEQFFP